MYALCFTLYLPKLDVTLPKALPVWEAQVRSLFYLTVPY